MALTREDIKSIKESVLINTLRQCRLFADLQDGDLHDISRCCSLILLEKGEILFHENEPAKGFYIVHSGAVRVFRNMARGREQIICIFKEGESFAEATLATDDSYPADSAALENSQVILVHKKGFLGLIQKNPELALRMLSSMSIHLKYLVSLMEDFKYKHIEGRLASWLLLHMTQCFKGQSPVTSLEMSKGILASQLGVASETLSRTLAKFREMNLIQVEGRDITLLDIDGLQSLVDSDMTDSPPTDG